MTLREKINALLEELEALKDDGKNDIEELRIKFLGKKGKLAQMFEEFKTVPTEDKRELGQKLNALKNKAHEIIDRLKENKGPQPEEPSAEDYTLPGDSFTLGSRHPISIARNRIIEIFKLLGYSVVEGPEIEDDWHVFSTLNFPPEHPARDMQDTFFIKTDTKNSILLRPHTSSVQVRAMESMTPPIRIVCPGRVFRNEAISARAHCIFHQIEGLYIDENVSFADLKQSILFFVQECFGTHTRIRFRPSYFPFTEPSAEVDISCNICGGKGCNICKGTGWLEIMGAGMVDPNVLRMSRIDPEKYTGFAFGMGIERIAMLLWQVKDLRLYFENDVRFLSQFETLV